MAEFHIISKPGCPYCEKAKELLQRDGYSVSLDIKVSEADVAAFKAEGFKTFPQVFHGGKLVGGYSDLVPYVEELTF